jgi:GH43 family beta-xylosidase
VNPVYGEYFADPFVLSHQGTYFAYGTAPDAGGGWAFPVLQSTDLVYWQNMGWALQKPTGALDCWAPEVAWADGRFFMYYSTVMPGEQGQRLRVATSDMPLGPFKDAGLALVPDQPFSIDAHPFRDADGQWYLYYARDFVPPEVSDYVGTGIVVDRLLAMTRLAGDPRLVVRPHAAWQLFESQRAMYGAIYDWHTIEGPAVRRHNGRYYCFCSGGAWASECYGVSYVVADRPLGPYRLPDRVAGPIFRSVPGRVLGPGHNSFVAAPDGQQEYSVYHAWDPAMTARLMRIDRLDWLGDEPILNGPTWDSQPMPR